MVKIIFEKEGKKYAGSVFPRRKEKFPPSRPANSFGRPIAISASGQKKGCPKAALSRLSPGLVVVAPARVRAVNQMMRRRTPVSGAPDPETAPRPTPRSMREVGSSPHFDLKNAGFSQGRETARHK